MNRVGLTAEQLAGRRERQQQKQRESRAANPEKYEAAKLRLKLWKIAKGPPTAEDKAKNAAYQKKFRDARRARGESPWFKKLSPERKAKNAVRAREKYLARRLEGRPRVLTEDQKKRKAFREASRVRKPSVLRIGRLPVARSWAERPTGSVLACAAPSEARDLLAQITQAVPRCDDRDEIIAEACLLVLGGASAEEAVREARKIVRRSAAPLAYTKPLHDCFWL